MMKNLTDLIFKFGGRRKKVKFKIEGKPIGKGRPRFTNAGGYVRTYTPASTKEYEEEIARAFNLQCKIDDEDFEKEIYMKIKAHFEPPKSTSKKIRQLLVQGMGYRHKPDIDNITKIVLDGLNGVAYKDDNQITKIEAKKIYNETSYIEVEINYLED